MTLNISISPESEIRLREIALAEGKDIAQFVSQLVEKEVRGSNGSSSSAGVEKQLTALTRFIERVRRDDRSLLPP
jgi:hypothetical protein